MEHLTKRQSVELVKFIFDQHGNSLKQVQFTELVLVRIPVIVNTDSGRP